MWQISSANSKSRAQRIQRLDSAAILESGAVSYVRQRGALSLIGLDPANTVFLLRAEPCLLVRPFSLARQFSHFIANISRLAYSHPPEQLNPLGESSTQGIPRLSNIAPVPSNRHGLSTRAIPSRRRGVCGASASRRAFPQELFGTAACQFPTITAHPAKAP